MSRPLVDYSPISKPTFKQFIKDHPKLGFGKTDYQKFKTIIESCNLLIADSIIKGEFSENLPWGFGKLEIIKFKSKGKHVDYQASKQAGKVVYHMNFHTDGWRCKTYWRRTKYVDNIHYWTLRPYRSMSRGLAALLKGPDSALYISRFRENLHPPKKNRKHSYPKNTTE